MWTLSLKPSLCLSKRDRTSFFFPCGGLWTRGKHWVCSLLLLNWCHLLPLVVLVKLSPPLFFCSWNAFFFDCSNGFVPFFLSFVNHPAYNERHPPHFIAHRHFENRMGAHMKNITQVNAYSQNGGPINTRQTSRTRSHSKNTHTPPPCLTTGLV